MSTLLDSLRRAHQADTGVPPASDGGRRVEAILPTLGYAQHRRRMQVAKLVAGGVAVASVVLLGWVMWSGPASMPPGTQVAPDVSTVDPFSAPPGAPVADATSLTPRGATGPTGAIETARGGTLSGTRPPAVEEVGHDPPGSDPGAVAPVALEPAEDALVAPVEPSGVDDSAWSITRPPAAPADLLDPPPVPTIDRGPVVTGQFAAALAIQRAGDDAGAIAEYQTIRAEGALSAQVHNNLGLLYQEQNRLDAAVGEFQRAIAIDPRHSKAYNNLGVVRMRQVRHQDAAAAFRDARRHDGANLDAWINLALALQAGGDPVAARRTLVDALSVDARHAPTHYNLARLFELGGDTARAVEHYGRFVEHSGAEHADLVEIARSRIAVLSGHIRR